MCNGVQNNRMDTDEEYVEYDDDADDVDRPMRKAEAKQPPTVKRYKDDTYRCVVRATG